MKRIAVTGATGYIGGRLVPRLLEVGYIVRCLVRSPRKLQNRTWANDSNVEIVKADLGDGQSLTTNLRDCEAAYFLVHSITSAGAEYVERDLHLASTFAHAAKEAAVQRIVYLGGLGETGPRLWAGRALTERLLLKLSLCRLISVVQSFCDRVSITDVPSPSATTLSALPRSN